MVAMMNFFMKDYVKSPKRQINDFFESDAHKFEDDRWKARPEAIYDFNATKKALERCLLFMESGSSIRVLDIGCGTGTWGCELRNLGLKIDYFGVDFSIKMLLKAKEVDRKAIPVASNNYILADAEKLPFKGKKFDMILCIHSLEYLMNPLEFLKTICDMLSDKGILFIVTKNHGAVFWRVIKKLSEFMHPNPLPFQRYFRAKELNHILTSADINTLEWGGVTLRPPTYIGDVNDAFTLGLPRKLSKLICAIAWIFETKFSRVTWFRENCFWHFYIICRKS